MRFPDKSQQWISGKEYNWMLMITIIRIYFIFNKWWNVILRFIKEKYLILFENFNIELSLFYSLLIIIIIIN